MNDYSLHCLSRSIVELVESMHDEFDGVTTKMVIEALTNDEIITSEDATDLINYIDDFEALNNG